MKLHLPKMLLGAVLATFAISHAAVTTADSIIVEGTTYTGNVSYMDGNGDITAENLNGVDYIVLKNNTTIDHETLISTPTNGEYATIILAEYGEGSDKSGQLCVDIWNKSSVTIWNDILLGKTSNAGGALRLHESNDNRHIVLAGDITVVDDALIRVGGGGGNGQHNYIQGAVNGSGKTLTIDKQNSYDYNVERINFSGGATLGTLNGNANIKLAATHEDGSAATNLVYTVENYESTGTMTVDRGVQFNVTNSATISSAFENNGTATFANAAINSSFVNNGTASFDSATINSSFVNNGTASFDNVTINSSFVNNSDVTFADVTVSNTITNNGSLNITGNITISESQLVGLKYNTVGTETGEFSHGDNGWKLMTGASYYLVDSTVDSATHSVAANTITIGSLAGVLLDKTSESGKISFTYSETSYSTHTTYYANSGISSLNSTAAPSYVIAEGATLKFADSITGAHTYDVTGKGTLEIIVGKTNGHDTKLTMTGFEGVLAITKSNEDGNRGNVNLLDYVLGTDASFKLISGNHWSGNDTISRDILLAGENEADFQFCHNGGTTLTLSGKVTGTHLYSGRDYNDQYDNNLKLSGAGSDIANVKMVGGTLTVDADMQFGKVTAPTVVINQGKTLTVGSETDTVTSQITNLTLGEASTLKVQHGDTLNLAGTVTGGNGKIAINGGAKVNYTGSSKVSGLSSVDIDGGVLQIQNDANTGETALNVNLKGNGATIQMYQKSEFERNLNISVEGNNNILMNGWGGHGGYVKGTISGEGELELRNNIWNGGPTTDHWNLESTISDKSATEKLAIVNVSATTTIKGTNTYSGGTTIQSGTVTTDNTSALGTGKVTMEGGTLKQASALSVSDMDYTGGTVNNNGQKLTVTGKLTAAAAMTIEGSGDTELGSLDLTAGTTLSTSGSLTIGELILDLDNYTDYTRTYDLVSVSGEGKSVTLTSGCTGSVNGYNYTVDGSGTTTLTLNFTKEPAQSDSLTTTVLDASLNGTMLTLTVDGDITADTLSANITGFADGVLADILNLTKGVADGMVGITLVDGDATLDDTIVGNGVDNVGFYGAYYGAGNGQYFVQYIPEPATATLSLLALAGLAARRRRK